MMMDASPLLPGESHPFAQIATLSVDRLAIGTRRIAADIVKRRLLPN